jgi:ankyrin repeat protein
MSSPFLDFFFFLKAQIVNDDFVVNVLQEGTTPLILAAANNHVQCVQELLDQGADPNARRLVLYI